MEASQIGILPETPPTHPAAPLEVRRVDVSKTNITTLYDRSWRDRKDAIVE